MDREGGAAGEHRSALGLPDSEFLAQGLGDAQLLQNLGVLQVVIDLDGLDQGFGVAPGVFKELLCRLPFELFQGHGKLDQVAAGFALRAVPEVLFLAEGRDRRRRVLARRTGELGVLADRYFAQQQRPAGNAEAGDLEHLTRQEFVHKWEEVLNEIYPDLIERIERTYKNWHPVLRAHLRDETGLKHPAGRGRQSLSVEIVPGLPLKLGEILKQFRGKEWILLGRDKLAHALDGAQFIQRHHEKAKALFGNTPVPATDFEVEHFKDLADILVKKCDVETIDAAFKALDEDVLGAYFFYQYRIKLTGWPSASLRPGSGSPSSP